MNSVEIAELKARLSEYLRSVSVAFALAIAACTVAAGPNTLCFGL
jgi:hypothetical protein